MSTPFAAGDRALMKYLGTHAGRPLYAGTRCGFAGALRLMKDTGLVSAGRRVFVGADCQTGGADRALMKFVGRVDGRPAYVGACCSTECCADAPLPATLTGTATAYGWDTSVTPPVLRRISDNAITLTRSLCLSGTWAGRFTWTGTGALTGCDEHGPCGAGGSGSPGCPVAVALFCVADATIPPERARWRGRIGFGDFTGPIDGCDMGAGTGESGLWPVRTDASVACSPLCATFTAGTAVQFGDTASTCRVVVVRFGPGCPAGSGGGAVTTAACANAISESLGGSLAVTAGSAPALDGATFTVGYLGNFGGTDVWRGTFVAGGHTIYVDLTVRSDGTVAVFPFGAEPGCLDASGGTTFACGPPFEATGAFTTGPGDACFPSVSFTLSLTE